MDEILINILSTGLMIALAALLGYKAAEAKILKELEKIVKRYDDPELFMLELKELIKKGD